MVDLLDLVALERDMSFVRHVRPFADGGLWFASIDVGYCLDAHHEVPGGSTRRFESAITGDVSAVQSTFVRDGAF